MLLKGNPRWETNVQPIVAWYNVQAATCYIFQRPHQYYPLRGPAPLPHGLWDWWATRALPERERERERERESCRIWAWNRVSKQLVTKSMWLCRSAQAILLYKTLRHQRSCCLSVGSQRSCTTTFTVTPRMFSLTLSVVIRASKGNTRDTLPMSLLGS